VSPTRWIGLARPGALGVLIACAVAAPAPAAPGVVNPNTAANFPYPNPDPITGPDTSARDPGMMIRPTPPRYALVSTGARIPFRSSTDRVAWTAKQPSFRPGHEPSWWKDWLLPADPLNSPVWAPEISYHDGRYWMYYSTSWYWRNPSTGNLEGSQYAAIGLATSDTGLPDTSTYDSWQDQGIVITSKLDGADQTPWNKAIDPNLVVTPA
jgi:arabinan endo-1,5-alpha-L-arabinosidase